MKSSLKITIIIIFLALFATLPTLSHAQIPSSIDGVQISTDPEIPAPGQTVTVSVESFSTDLNSASIVWLVDGKNYSQGKGKKFIGVVAPPIGKNMSILVAIMTVEGREVKKAITLKSGGVDLIWESDGYVPPFYKGKALFAYENPVRITAMPHLAGVGGKELDPNTLVYKWTENDKAVQDQSGFGKQTILLQEGVPRPIDIKVEVTTNTGTEKATASMTLTPGNPSVSFYEEDPLYGVLYNKAITDNFHLTNQEMSIRAVPYTFNIGGLSYLWSINNLERTDLSTNESITLRTKGDAEGSSDISLEVKNLQDILQGARNNTSIWFSKKSADTNATF
jgi:hypothetical protein